MTNEELFNDLKQFIEATVSQHVSGVERRLDGVDRRIEGVERRLDGVERRFDITDEKLDEIQNAIADNVQDHERRIQRLEHRAV
ncbi:hypothetical protein ETD83_29475 [Actinomadura soli]|uniref:Uncharacterized protein n=1 Tax=Actinomadura soli TaxID=2508997 RepID=A0A5C4J4N8_9ACTN|nr:hypothetical protein [Actinomadura soli]TMQ91735.1 hypothetical protein ETD83_29475 [Actinomadura soli]